MHPIYCFSGLGADERVFGRIDFGAYSPVFVRWLPPLPHETLSAYAQRLLPQIQTENPILLGVSFGGIVAVEIAKRIPTQRVIIISSVHSYRQIPGYWRLAGKLGLHRCLPYRLMQRGNFLVYWLFHAKSSDEKKLLGAIIRDTDVDFLRWAIAQIVTWHGVYPLDNLVHIHGSADRLFPISLVPADYVLPNGGHWMIWNRASEISAILQKLLPSNTSCLPI